MTFVLPPSSPITNNVIVNSAPLASPMLPALIYLTINQQNTRNLGFVSDAQQDRVSLVSEKSFVESPFGEKVSWATLVL